MNDYDLGPSMAGLGIDATSVSSLRGSLAAFLRSATMVRQAISDDEEEEETLPFSSCSSDTSSEYYDAEDHFSDFYENVTLSPQPGPRHPPSPQPSPESASRQSPQLVEPDTSFDFLESTASSLLPPSPNTSPAIQINLEESISDFPKSITEYPAPPSSPELPKTSLETEQKTLFPLYEIQTQIQDISIESEPGSTSPEKSIQLLTPQTRVRRSSSLRRPPEIGEEYDYPGSKKAVRFADSLGLDLGEVRTFKDDIPQVPVSAYSDLSPSTWDLRTACDEATNSNTSSSSNCKLLLQPLFSHTGSAHPRLSRDKICLLKTDVRCTRPDCLNIRIDALVLNIAFDKHVFTRFTTDNWQNSHEVIGCWINGDEETDTFRMTFFVPNIHVGNVIEIALCFKCNGTEHWDNNEGRNYIYRCIEVPS